MEKLERDKKAMRVSIVITITYWAITVTLVPILTFLIAKRFNLTDIRGELIGLGLGTIWLFVFGILGGVRVFGYVYTRVSGEEW